MISPSTRIHHALVLLMTPNAAASAAIGRARLGVVEPCEVRVALEHHVLDKHFDLHLHDMLQDCKDAENSAKTTNKDSEALSRPWAVVGAREIRALRAFISTTDLCLCRSWVPRPLQPGRPSFLAVPEPGEEVSMCHESHMCQPGGQGGVPHEVPCCPYSLSRWSSAFHVCRSSTASVRRIVILIGPPLPRHVLVLHMAESARIASLASL